MSIKPDPSVGFDLSYSQPPHRSQAEFLSRSEHRLNYLKFLRVLNPDGNILFDVAPDEFIPRNWKGVGLNANTTQIDDAWFPFDAFQIGYANISKPDVSPGAHYVKDHHPQRSHELYEPHRGQGRVLTFLSVRNTVVASRHLNMHEMPLTQSMDMIICGHNFHYKSICWALNPARNEEFIVRDPALSNLVPRSEIDAKIEAVKPQLMKAYFGLLHHGNDLGGPI